MYENLNTNYNYTPITNSMTSKTNHTQYAHWFALLYFTLLYCCLKYAGPLFSLTVVTRPVFRYFTPLGPRKFCAAPPYLFVFSYV